MGGQISWLLPAALIALAAAGLAVLAARRGPTSVRAAALLWGGWLLVTGLVFSFMSGIIHPYYTVALAPAIGALTGIGAVTLWRTRRSLAAGRLPLAARCWSRRPGRSCCWAAARLVPLAAAPWCWSAGGRGGRG